MTTVSGSWLTTPEPTVEAQWREDQKAPAKTPAPPYPPPLPSAASHAPDIRAIDPAYARQRGADQGGYQNHDNAVGGWPDDDEQQAFEEFDFDEESFSPKNGNQRRDPEAMDLNDVGRKLRPWHAIVAVAALAVVSIGWSFLHRSGAGGSREIATIQAPEGPMKVKPTIEPEPDAPTAGAATVLDRNEAEPVKKVVKNLEQAVDPSVAPQQNDAANPETTPPAETPKVVQLGAGPVDAPHEPPPARAVQQPRKVKSVAVPAIPVTQPLEQATAAPPQPTAPAAPKLATAGTYSAQFASANSEAEARTLLKNLSGKYGGATGGGKFTFRPVKSGDKTVYRIRVGGLTREGAEALCAKAKAGGDACAATGN